MEALAKYEKAIMRFFFRNREQDHYFLVFFRVSIALLFLIHFCATWRDFAMLYGSTGILPADLSGLFKENWIPSFSQISSFLADAFSTTESANMVLFKTAVVLASLLLLAGLATRPAAVLLLVLHLVLAKGTYLYAYGIDYFKTIALFYCCVFPVGRQWSLDNLLFRRRMDSFVNPTPFRRVLQLHMSLVYFFSGLDKLVGFNWRNGEAVWKALHLPYNKTELGGLLLTPLAPWPFLFVLMGWAIVLIELCYPAFIFPRKTRAVWLGLTVLMHLGIMFFLNLPYFAMLMILLNLAAFLNLPNRDTLHVAGK